MLCNPAVPDEFMRELSSLSSNMTPDHKGDAHVTLIKLL